MPPINGPGGCDCISLEDQQLVESCGETVCTTCARVVESCLFDQRPEWFEDHLSRAAGPGRYDFLDDSNGAVAPAGKKRYAGPDKHKHTREGLKRVEQCAATLELPSDHQMCETAKRMYADYAAARTAQGRSIRETERLAAAACAVYFGCKTHERAGDRNPRTIKEVSGHCQIPLPDMADMMKSYKALLSGKPYFRLLFTTVSGDDLLVRAAGGIPFGDDAEKHRVLKRARDVMEIVRTNHYLEGRTPETVCCAVLYRACELTGVKIAKRDVYWACAVSNVTLNKALRDLKQFV